MGPISDLRRTSEPEQKQMLALHVGQHHRARNAIEHIRRRCPAAPLLQPGVPCRADIRALSDFLAPQAGRTPSPQRKAERGGIEPGAAIPQIGAEQVGVRHPVSSYTCISSLLYPNEKRSNIPVS